MTPHVEPKDPFDLCGVTIDGKYRVASVVGDGGFGVVYRGVHKGFGEVIAVKCLKLPAALDDAARAELLEKLQDEGRLLHRLSKATSGIVQALDVGAFTTDAGAWVPYLVMEWLEGETLAQYLKERELSGERPLGLAEAVALLEPTAKALGVAHSQKVAHRDVKPANIFVSEVGGKRTTKILDFGIAKVLSDSRGYTTALEATNMAPTAFTPRYGAPEQFNKQRGATGPWTDVFALALVLVECVSGRKALEGDDPTQLYIASADPALRPTLRSRGIEVPDAAEAALRKALEVEPKNRYANASDFWADLETAVRGAAAAPSSGASALPSKTSSGRWAPASDAMLDTNEFAAKHNLDGAAASKSAFGPTMPAELVKTKRGSSAQLEDTDASPQPRTSTTAERKERKSALGWLAASALVFAGGGYFAYRTLVAPPSPEVAPTASVSAAPSTSASAKRSSAPSARSSASTRPSAAPSVRPSAEPSATPSAAPSASGAPSAPASAAPSSPPFDVQDMVKIPAGSVRVGEDSSETAVAAFYLDAAEVSTRRFKMCVNAGSCLGATSPMGIEDVATWKPLCNFDREGRERHPINCVTYSQADDFCKWAGKRLPTEAEWELAARSAAGHRFVWGDEAPSCSSACFDKNDGCKSTEPASTCASGSVPGDRTKNLLQDLAGNVSEWVQTADRLTKGGSFFDGPDALVLTRRERRPIEFAHPTVGFRCAAP
jgi:eukaryotic-like serine/threonine-protein kinase